jgi:uncharacterized protein YqjF (DUF2071 family)
VKGVLRDAGTVRPSSSTETQVTQDPQAEPDDAPYGARCEVPIARAAMVQWWDDLTFLHYRYSADDVQRLLPDGLVVETRDGSAWVSLVPFFLRVGLPGLPSVRWFSRFAETNVRTYVRAEDGTTGIWFFSLDAARLGAVVVARGTYRLPYFWARMRIERSGADRIVYSTRRRWPGPRGATSRVEIAIGEPFGEDELGELDHFLTARWALFSAPLAGVRRARAFHDPWPLHRAELIHCDDQLMAAAGLPLPVGLPLVHYSPSVSVRIGWPAKIGSA